jgi:histidine triad (HIT) family protein
MEECIFCKIVSGEEPCFQIYEDNIFFAFLDIFPVSKGHVLLIPKKHYKWVHDVPEFSKYWEKALMIKQTIDKSLNPKWVQYFTYGVIEHAHIHIIPRYENLPGSPLLPQARESKASDEELQEIAEKIRKNL